MWSGLLISLFIPYEWLFLTGIICPVQATLVSTAAPTRYWAQEVEGSVERDSESKRESSHSSSIWMGFPFAKVAHSPNDNHVEDNNTPPRQRQLSRLQGPEPFEYCDSDTIYAGNVDSLTLQPFPLIAGMPLTATIEGDLHTTILPGAKLVIEVKKGFIPLKHMEVDVCAITAASGSPCPVAPGQRYLSDTQDIPDYAPPGKYGMYIKVINGDGSMMICLKGQIAIRLQSETSAAWSWTHRPTSAEYAPVHTDGEGTRDERDYILTNPLNAMNAWW